MILLSIQDLIGHLHPLLVHLPVGILLLGCLFQLLSAHSKFSLLRAVVPFIYLLGGISAVFSSVTGYLLSQSGEYEGAAVNIHQWLGISVSVISFGVYLLYRRAAGERLLNLAACGLIVLIALTGHYGGSLTHGSDYLISAWNNGETGKAAIPPVPNVQQAVVYAHMIEPLLKNRCYSCHGADKQKGKLRLDAKEFMLKGGEDGKAIVPGSPEEGELIKRLLLPASNKDHMPPKEKAQLSPEEIQLLTWWITEGADFSKKVEELKQPEKIKPVLMSFQQGAVKNAGAVSDIPADEVAKGDAAVIARLKEAGVMLIPVAAGSNYLSASFVTAKAVPETLKMLAELKKQLLWLNLASTRLDDNGIKALQDLTALVRVNLSNTSVTDRGISVLKGLRNLQYINLVSTKVTARGVEQLAGLKSLRNLYLYESAVNKEDTAQLKKTLHKVNLEFGGYIVPTFVKDTTEVKPPAPN